MVIQTKKFNVTQLSKNLICNIKSSTKLFLKY